MPEVYDAFVNYAEYRNYVIFFLQSPAEEKELTITMQDSNEIYRILNCSSCLQSMMVVMAIKCPANAEEKEVEEGNHNDDIHDKDDDEVEQLVKEDEEATEDNNSDNNTEAAKGVENDNNNNDNNIMQQQVSNANAILQCTSLVLKDLSLAKLKIETLDK